jgi:hypothetical protein
MRRLVAPRLVGRSSQPTNLPDRERDGGRAGASGDDLCQAPTPESSISAWPPRISSTEPARTSQRPPTRHAGATSSVLPLHLKAISVPSTEWPWCGLIHCKRSGYCAAATVRSDGEVPSVGHGFQFDCDMRAVSPQARKSIKSQPSARSVVPSGSSAQQALKSQPVTHLSPGCGPVRRTDLLISMASFTTYSPLGTRTYSSGSRSR